MAGRISSTLLTAAAAFPSRRFQVVLQLARGCTRGVVEPALVKAGLWDLNYFDYAPPQQPFATGKATHATVLAAAQLRDVELIRGDIDHSELR